MKGNSDLNLISVVNFFLRDNGQKSDFTADKLHNDISPDLKSQNFEFKNLWNHFWKRLVFQPLSFPQNPHTPIFNLLEEDIESLAFNSIRSVLSKKLELSMSSEELSKAIENSIKIFHEDFPYDFILEYNGERLGLMLLDKCFTSMGEAELIYKFNPHITNFRGLF